MSLGVVFSCQGNQYPEMFTKLNLYQSNIVNNLATKLDLILTPHIELSQEQLFTNKFAQPLIVGYEYIIWQLISPYIPPIVAMTGYSLGEISAFACSSGLSIDNLLSLTKLRSSLMSNCGEHESGMAAITGLSLDRITDLCNDFACYISIVNGFDQYVIGGLNSDLSQCLDSLADLKQNIKVTKLNVAVASHTLILKNAGTLFLNELEKYKNQRLTTKVISGVLANVHYTTETLIGELSRQIYTTIQFDKVIRVLYEVGTTVVLEIGPGRALANIIKKYNLPIKVKSIDDFSSIDGLITWINKNVNLD